MDFDRSPITNAAPGELVQGKVSRFMEELRTWTPEAGVPQGAVLSPVLANAYLNPLDHHRAGLGYQMVRYADEFVILCRTREEAEAALAEVQQWVETHELTLHPEKTNIVDARDKRFSFLGYSFRAASCFPREKSHQKFVNRIRELTRRKSGESLEVIIQRINRCSQRQFNYFRHGYWSIFKDYDGMIRRRLRHFLLKRRRRNRKRHSRTRRWPNVYFTERRFMSVNAAHVRFVQSIGTDWRAVCGKTVCTVRREGRPNSIGRPYPYLRS